MDLTLQVSYTETFNIVSADATIAGVPVVSSDEIYFINKLFTANPNDIDDIVWKMRIAKYFDWLGVWLNQIKLRQKVHHAELVWAKTNRNFV